MSDTRRRVSPGWHIGDRAFDEFNASLRRLHIPGVTQRPVESDKDQQKDRSGKGKQGGRFGRFINHGKNALWNLQRKTEASRAREEME